MKNLRIVFAIMIIASLVSCLTNHQKEINLKADEDLTAIFSNAEIEGIASMIKYADSTVVAYTNIQDAAEAYHSFLDAYGKSINNGGERIIPFKEQEKYDFLAKLDKGVFDAFWNFDTHIDQLKYKDTILINVDYLKCLEINFSGRYMEYLKRVGNVDSRYADLYDKISAMGDMPATTLWPVHKDFDFNLVKNRIFVAIYVLRIEDSYETKLDKYFSENNTNNNI